jgi:hypothetical protein
MNRDARQTTPEISEGPNLTLHGVSGDTVATDALSSEFLNYYHQAGRWAFVWSAIVVGSLLLASSAAVWLLVAAGPLSWQETIGRLAASLPLFAIAGYAARVAKQNRQNSHWAKTMAIQLRTISAYSESLNEKSRNALRLEFGRRVFADPLVTGSTDVGKTDLVPPDLSASVDRLSEVLASVGAARGAGEK